MRLSILVTLLLALAGCGATLDIPSSTPIYENAIVLVESDVDLGAQTLYKNEQLTRYKIEGVDAYCSKLFSMNTSLYRCFAVEGDKLVRGLNPETSDWEKLPQPVTIIKK